MFEVINASEWEAVGVVATGRRPKEWIVEPGSRRRALFKSVVHHPAEVAVERVAPEIGRLVGIDAAETVLAIRNGVRGILSFIVTEDTEVLIDGGDLLLSVEPVFDRAHARVHSFQLVRQALPTALLPAFIGLLVFDAVIGNSDRHQDNWSIIEARPAAARLAPSYDHGSSLGRDISEEAAMNGMSSDMLNNYVRNGRSRVGWREDDVTRRLRHVELLQRIAGEHRGMVEGAVAKLRDVTRVETDCIIDELPEDFASAARKTLMKELLWRRITLIRDNFNDVA